MFKSIENNLHYPTTISKEVQKINYTILVKAIHEALEKHGLLFNSVKEALVQTSSSDNLQDTPIVITLPDICSLPTTSLQEPTFFAELLFSTQKLSHPSVKLEIILTLHLREPSGAKKIGYRTIQFHFPPQPRIISTTLLNALKMNLSVLAINSEMSLEEPSYQGLGIGTALLSLTPRLILAGLSIFSLNQAQPDIIFAFLIDYAQDLSLNSSIQHKHSRRNWTSTLAPQVKLPDQEDLPLFVKSPETLNNFLSSRMMRDLGGPDLFYVWPIKQLSEQS
jgi:hypothetical protein